MTIKPLVVAGVSAGAVSVPTAIYYAVGSFSKGKTVASEYSDLSIESLSIDAKTSALDKVPTACAGRFFPGVKFGTSNTSGKDSHIPDNNVEAEKQIGCALLQLDYKSSSNFVFSAEIAVKTDTIGWSIRIYVNPNNDGESSSSLDSTQRFTYTIFWLTRDSDTKKWKVDSGVYVKTKNTADPYASNISFPNKEILVSGNEVAGISNNKVWLGVWEETASNNKRIFEGVDLKYNLDSGSQLCLGESVSGAEGASSNQGPCSDIDNVVTQIMEVKKTYKNHSWFEESGTFSDIRDKYQNQLQSKTGTWTWHDSIQDFCDTLKSDESQPKKFKNFCHVYKN